MPLFTLHFAEHEGEEKGSSISEGGQCLVSWPSSQQQSSLACLSICLCGDFGFDVESGMCGRTDGGRADKDGFGSSGGVNVAGDTRVVGLKCLLLQYLQSFFFPPQRRK